MKPVAMIAWTLTWKGKKSRCVQYLGQGAWRIEDLINGRWEFSAQAADPQTLLRVLAGSV